MHFKVKGDILTESQNENQLKLQSHQSEKILTTNQGIRIRPFVIRRFYF